MSVSTLAVGKFLPLWGVTSQSSFGPWEIGLVIWAMDTVTVIVIVYAREWLCSIAVVGRLFDKLGRNARMVLGAYPGIRKSAVVGVALFVLFPVAGTGAIAGALLGILLGLHRFVVIAAVSAGGLLGGMLMAFLASCFGESLIGLRDLQQHQGVTYAAIAVLVLGAVLAVRRLSRAYRRAFEQAQICDPDHSG